MEKIEVKKVRATAYRAICPICGFEIVTLNQKQAETLMKIHINSKHK